MVEFEFKRCIETKAENIWRIFMHVVILNQSGYFSYFNIKDSSKYCLSKISDIRNRRKIIFIISNLFGSKNWSENSFSS